jgi:1,4-dihydroxy-2-naphthoate octaprenyltransferase
MSNQLTQKNVNLWLEAARPKTLTAAFIPMLVGTYLAVYQQYTVNWWITGCALLCAMLIQVGTNLVNDSLDFENGCDTASRLGPKRVSAAGLLPSREVLNLGLACLMTAILVGMPLIFTGGTPLALIICTSALLGYLYTGGPRPLAYNGLGDIFVFLFFGLVATGAMYYLQTNRFSMDALIAGAQVGMTATVLIAINNLRDFAEDKLSGKRTFAVRYGKHAARKEIIALLFAPYILGIYWWSTVTLLPLTTLPLAGFIAWQIWTTEPSKVYNHYLLQSSVFHLMFGVTLAAGFWLS